MSGPLYQKYGNVTSDPSKSLLDATKATGAGLKEVLGGIKELMQNQEGQIIQGRTQQASDLFKQKIQERGLGILANPLDQEVELRPFGNMIDKAAVAKTVTDFTERLKNDHINRLSIGADEIGSQTGDYIKARDFLKQGLVAAGAPTTIADTVAVDYDLRKAAEIKNIATRKAEALTIGSADVEQVAITQGYDAAHKAKNDFIATLPKKEQPAARKQVDDHLTAISTPDKYDQDQVNQYMKNFDDTADDLIKSASASVEQENAANRQVLHNQSSDGSTGGRGRKSKDGKNSSPNTVDGKSGLPVVDSPESWAKRVTNPVEGWSSTNDGIAIRDMHNSVLKAVGYDKGKADEIIDTALRTQYKGDGVFGNNFTKAELKKATEEADRLVSAHQKGAEDYDTAIGASRSSSRLAGKFVDNKKVTDLVSKLAIQRAALYAGLMSTARDTKLRGNNPVDTTNAAAPDRLALKYRELVQQSEPAPNATPTPVGKTGKGTNKISARPAEGDYSAAAVAKVKAEEDARTDAANLKKGVKPPASVKGDETEAEALTRIMAAKKKSKGGTAVVTPQATPAPVAETERQMFDRQKLERQANYDKMSQNTSRFFNRNSTDNSDAGKIKAGQVKVVSPRSPGGWAWAKESDVIRLNLKRYTK